MNLFTFNWQLSTLSLCNVFLLFIQFVYISHWKIHSKCPSFCPLNVYFKFFDDNLLQKKYISFKLDERSNVDYRCAENIPPEMYLSQIATSIFVWRNFKLDNSLQYSRRYCKIRERFYFILFNSHRRCKRVFLNVSMQLFFK